ncbi:sugar phosphate nucleotidyltransferase [Candidatus Pelagibacter sp.]|nr:sugar phosphate nucleotidyltransferase [Candidatus Pelagibacter sp.]
MKKNNSSTVLSTTSIRESLKKMDVENKNSLVVLGNDNRVLGVFSSGDFRRAVFKGVDVNQEISLAMNKKFNYLIKGYSKDEAREIFIRNSLVQEVPILDKKFQLLEIIKRNDFIDDQDLNSENFNFKDISVVIMAGGKGTRLDPFTRILPKPLFPLGDKPIILEIMNSFNKFNVSNFYISINDKAKIIKAYFHQHNFPYVVNYIEEDKPLGTAGSLRMIKDKIKSTFFLTNCDILIYSHYPSIMEFHKKNNHDLTLVTSLRNYSIPYGVCDIDKSGQLIKMNEKPEYDFLVNTGLYVLEPKILELIPKNKVFDMSELINLLNKKKMKIGVFPVSEKSWIDLGQWKVFPENIK